MPAEKLHPDEMRRLLSSIHTLPPAAAPQPAAPGTRKWLAWVAGLLIVSGWGLAGFALTRPAGQGRANAAAHAAAADAHAGAAKPGASASPAGSVLDASGYVYATRHATVSSEITGRVAHVYTREGEFVKKGTLLADLEVANFLTPIRLAEAELASNRSLLTEAQVQLDEARHKFERTQSLVAHGFLSNQKLDDDKYRIALLEAQAGTRKSEIEAARKRLAIQEQQLNNTRVYAPFDGVVTEQPAQVGEIVSPISAGGGFTRTGICTLLDVSSLEVQVNVSEQFIGKVHKDQKVKIRMQAYPDLALKGVVSSVMPAANRDTAAIKVSIAFIDRDDRVLPNMGANVSFE